MLALWRISRGLLELSLCWTPEEVGSNTHEGMPQLQADEFTSEDEGKQEKSKRFRLPCPCMWAATEGMARFRVGLPTSNESEKPSQVSQLLGL